MAYDDDFEELLDDPITINFQSGNIGKNNLYESEIIDVDCTADDDVDIIVDLTDKPRSDTHGPFSSEKSQDLTYEIKPLDIKLIDCFKYPWYYRRYRSEIMRNKILQYNENKSPKVRMHFEYNKDKEKGVSCKKNINEKEYMNHKLEIEIREAMKQRNKFKIDLKRNKGLIGMVIIEENNNRDSKHSSKKKHNKSKHKEPRSPDNRKSPKHNANNETIHEITSNYVQSNPNITNTQIESQNINKPELNKPEYQNDTSKAITVENNNIDLTKTPEDQTKYTVEGPKKDDIIKDDITPKNNPLSNEMVIRYYQNGKLVTRTVKCTDLKNKAKKQNVSNNPITNEINREVPQDYVAVVAPNVSRNETHEYTMNVDKTTPTTINNLNDVHTNGLNTNNINSLLSNGANTIHNVPTSHVMNNMNYGHTEHLHIPENTRHIPITIPSLGSSRMYGDGNLETHVEDPRKKQKTTTDKHQIHQPVYNPFTHQTSLNNYSTMNYSEMSCNTAPGHAVNGVISNNEIHGVDTQGMSREQMKKFLLHVVAYDKTSPTGEKRILYRNTQNKAAPIVTTASVNYPHMHQFLQHNNYPVMNQHFANSNKNQQIPISNGQTATQPKPYTMQSILARQTKPNENNVVPPIYTNVSRSECTYMPYPPPVHSQNQQNFRHPAMQGIPRPYYPNFYIPRSNCDATMYNSNPIPVRCNNPNQVGNQQNRSWPGVYGHRPPYPECPNLRPPPPMYSPQNHQLPTPNPLPHEENDSIIGRNDEGVIKKINIVAVPVGNTAEKKQLNKRRDSVTRVALSTPSPVKSDDKQVNNSESNNIRSEETIAIQKAMQKKLDDLITNIFDMPSLTAEPAIEGKVPDANDKIENNILYTETKKVAEKTDPEMNKNEVPNMQIETNQNVEINNSCSDVAKKIEVKTPPKPCPLSRKIKDQMVARYNKDREMNNNNTAAISSLLKDLPKKLFDTPKLPNKSILTTRLFEENEILIDKKISKKRYLFENVENTKPEPVKKISIEEYKRRALGNNGNLKIASKSDENQK